MSDRKKVYCAMGVSALLHVAGALLLIAWTWTRPVAPPADEEAKPLEVTLYQSPPEPTEVPVERVTAIPPKVKIMKPIDSDGLAVAEKPPENPIFESDQNSRAASEAPSKGTMSLPSQTGRDLPFAQFQTKEYAPEKNGESLPPPEPIATPVFKPTPVPAPAVSPTPPPLVTGVELPKPTPIATAATPPVLAMLMTPPPTSARLVKKPEQSQLQLQKERTKIEGNISNHGKSGVDAGEGPVGKFRKGMATAIGALWNENIRSRMDLITVGSAHIRFYVGENGKPQDIKVLSNTSSETFVAYTIKSIMDAKIPPLPKDVAPALENGRLEIEYTFTIYPE